MYICLHYGQVKNSYITTQRKKEDDIRYTKHLVSIHLRCKMLTRTLVGRWRTLQQPNTKQLVLPHFQEISPQENMHMKDYSKLNSIVFKKKNYMVCYKLVAGCFTVYACIVQQKE